MGVGTIVSVEEYLKTVYRPDCNYLDGVIEERNVGEFNHANVAGNLLGYFGIRFPETGVLAIPSWRFRLTSTLYRVPDVVLTLGKPTEQILTKTPLLCIEILSPEDTISRTNRRVQDYLEFGVPVVWVIDPTERRFGFTGRTGCRKLQTSQ